MPPEARFALFFHFFCSSLLQEVLSVSDAMENARQQVQQAIEGHQLSINGGVIIASFGQAYGREGLIAISDAMLKEKSQAHWGTSQKLAPGVLDNPPLHRTMVVPHATTVEKLVKLSRKERNKKLLPFRASEQGYKAMWSIRQALLQEGAENLVESGAAVMVVIVTKNTGPGNRLLKAYRRTLQENCGLKQIREDFVDPTEFSGKDVGMDGNPASYTVYADLWVQTH